MTEKKISTLFLLSSIIFVGLAIIGGIRAYSPIPFWDMWDGYLGFYVKVTSGDWSAWWAQHNEHRIVLARLFFWLDLAFFKGQGWFLIIVNYALQSMVCIIFWVIWKETKGEKNNWFGFFLICWLFWWIQKNNLEWGFQSQFILAQLLPLAALYFLHRAVRAGLDNKKYFVLALILGVLCIGSMANGVLALPIMTAYAVLIRMGVKRIVILTVTAILMPVIYFHGYVVPGGHGSLWQAISSNPFGLMQYILVYVGGALSFGSIHAGLWTATIAGCFLIASSIMFFWRVLPAARHKTLPLALLMFILYIGGTALGTAGGRLIFGVDQALASRYMTPSLMAWAALLILYIPSIDALQKKKQNISWILFAILLLLMLPKQLEALASKNDTLFERNIAALAIEMGVKDQVQISNVFPSADWALSIAKIPIEQNLSIFGVPPLSDLREQIGKIFDKKNYPVQGCTGHLDAIEQVPEDPRYIQIRGWIFNPYSDYDPGIIRFNDSNGKNIGFAFSGQSRPDVEIAIGGNTSKLGFKGYIFSEQQGKTVFSIGGDMQCQLVINIPIILFKVIHSDNLNPTTVASISSVTNDNEWLGKDFEKSNIPGMKVLGSFINSDTDVGSLTLRLKRGDRLFYRSGPTSGRQVVEILGSGWTPTLLPVTNEWKILEFSGEMLPDKFSARFSDNGRNWGEWSSIMLRN